MAYVGVTIGPLYETLQLAETPAALWCGSYMFSMLARTICNGLVEELGATICAPCHHEVPGDGVGRYYDRIVAQYNHKVITGDEIEKVLAKAKEEIASQVADVLGNAEGVKGALCQYMYTYYICMEEMEGQNALAQLDPYLDAMELYQTAPPCQRENPLVKLFRGRPDAQNALIKETSFFKKNPLCSLMTTRWLESDDSGERNDTIHVRSVEDIATNGRGIKKTAYKHQRYFAMVSLDGDRLGKISRAMPQDRVAAYQGLCREYVNGISEIVTGFGGMVVYGGGDDMLFIAPVVGKDGRSLFDCLDDIRAKFSRIFSNERLFNIPVEQGLDAPSVSFGVAIQHYKHPLAEALVESRNLLYAVKQDIHIKGKNGVGLTLKKASSEGNTLYFRNGCAVETGLREGIAGLLLNEKKKRKSDDISGEQTEDEKNILHSMIYHVAEQDQLIRMAAEQSEPFDILFRNIFDADIHRTQEGEPTDYVRTVLALLNSTVAARATGDARAPKVERQRRPRSEDGFLLECILRIVKFFGEGVNEA